MEPSTRKDVGRIDRHPCTWLTGCVVAAALFLVVGTVIPGYSATNRSHWRLHEHACFIEYAVTTRDNVCVGFGVEFPYDPSSKEQGVARINVWAIASANVCPGADALNATIASVGGVNATVDCLVPIDTASLYSASTRCDVASVDETLGRVLAHDCVDEHTVVLGDDWSQVDAIVDQLEPTPENAVRYYFIAIGAVLAAVSILLPLNGYIKQKCCRRASTFSSI